MKPNNYSFGVPYLVLSTLFCVCLIAANLLETKQVQIGPLQLTAGLIVFPVSYIINDCLVEVWGYRTARLTIWLGFLMNFLFVAFGALADALPAAPYWDSEATGLLTGITRTTGRAEIVKAGLECIAYQITDLVRGMAQDAGLPLSELRVDGGSTANGYLMQFQSDMARARICVQKAEELSAMGAAFLAGMGVGLYEESILAANRLKRAYEPQMDEEIRNEKYDGWKQAVEKA